MKNYLTLFLTFMLANFSLFAQSQIEGSISKEDGTAIKVATIKLYTTSNSMASKEMIVDEDGYFIMENIANGVYRLEIISTNYKPISIENLAFPKDSDKVMGLVMLNINSNTFGSAIIDDKDYKKKNSHFTDY